MGNDNVAYYCTVAYEGKRITDESIGRQDRRTDLPTNIIFDELNVSLTDEFNDCQDRQTDQRTNTIFDELNFLSRMSSTAAKIDDRTNGKILSLVY